MLVAESHYLSHNHNYQPEAFNSWYSDEYKDIFTEREFEKNWFNTSRVIGNYVAAPTAKYSSNIFKNIHNVMAKCLQQHKKITLRKGESFEYVAYMNFFQKPSLNGKTIIDTKVDRDEAKKNFDEVLSVLEPNLVVFLSRKSFNAYGKEVSDTIKVVSHPSSIWWFRSKGKHGSKKFGSLLDEFFK